MSVNEIVGECFWRGCQRIELQIGMEMMKDDSGWRIFKCIWKCCDEAGRGRNWMPWNFSIWIFYLHFSIIFFLFSVVLQLSVLYLVVFSFSYYDWLILDFFLSDLKLSFFRQFFSVAFIINKKTIRNMFAMLTLFFIIFHFLQIKRTSSNSAVISRSTVFNISLLSKIHCVDFLSNFILFLFFFKKLVLDWERPLLCIHEWIFSLCYLIVISSWFALSLILIFKSFPFAMCLLLLLLISVSLKYNYKCFHWFFFKI